MPSCLIILIWNHKYEPYDTFSKSLICIHYVIVKLVILQYDQKEFSTIT